MRRVFAREQLQELFREARAESAACFGSEEMYLEKLILNPRHIEFQIMADKFRQRHPAGGTGLLCAAKEPEADGGNALPCPDAGAP